MSRTIEKAFIIAPQICGRGDGANLRWWAHLLVFLVYIQSIKTINSQDTNGICVAIQTYTGEVRFNVANEQRDDASGIN